jgi:hypothetical protein
VLTESDNSDKLRSRNGLFSPARDIDTVRDKIYFINKDRTFNIRIRNYTFVVLLTVSMSLAGEKSPFLDLNLSLLSDSVSTSVGLDILDFDDV